MLAENSEIDLCVDDPGFDPDVYFLSDLRTMTELWLGDISLIDAEKSGKLVIKGCSQLMRNIPEWLMFSGFANIERGVA